MNFKLKAEIEVFPQNYTFFFLEKFLKIIQGSMNFIKSVNNLLLKTL